MANRDFKRTGAWYSPMRIAITAKAETAVTSSGRRLKK